MVEITVKHCPHLGQIAERGMRYSYILTASQLDLPQRGSIARDLSAGTRQLKQPIEVHGITHV